MQKTAQYRKRAAELLEGLTSRGRVTAEDQIGLARLYESIDDWPRARQKYQDLIGQSKSSRDVETRNRRWSYLFQFASRLLQHFKPGEEQDLIEAQELVDEIKQLQLDPLVSVPLQVDIYRLRKQIDRAVELIQATAKQMNESPQNLDRLASLAEKVERFDVAEQIYRRLAAKSGGARGSLPLALFLARHDDVKGALEICEKLWTDVGDIPVVATRCVGILFGSPDHPRKPEPAQIDRVAGWFDRAVAQQANQQRPNIGLFIAFGNLREKQQNYVEAEKWYLRTIQGGDRSGLALNNLAWLMAHYDGKVKEALVYANRAIDLRRDDPDFLDSRGVIYLLDGQPERAIEDLQRAVSGAPSHPAKHFHLALAFLANNDRKKAKESWETAKAKGFTQNSLDAFEEPSHQNLVKELGLP